MAVISATQWNGQSAVVRQRLPSRHSPEVGNRDMVIS
jgi:hypothetical protein